jgi:hypothetical protein
MPGVRRIFSREMLWREYLVFAELGDFYTSWVTISFWRSTQFRGSS